MKERKGLRRLYLWIILIFLYLPIFTLVVLSFNESKSMYKWTGLSFRWYLEIFQDRSILTAVFNTFAIALSAAAISTVIGVLACIGILSVSRRAQKVLLGFNQIPLLNADIVMGISLMLAFIAAGLYLNWGTVLMAHITFCVPYVILSVMPKLRQAGKDVYEAALDLGASPKFAFWKVVLPEIMPAVQSGFILAFTMSVDDFVVTHFTRGAGINTISTLIYSQLKVGVRPTMFALSTVIFALVLLVLLISNLSAARTERKKEGVKE
ncbi:MAG: ABC transporter permease [Eubacteriales bacterium]|nr:ABC transporter permease [Eubacteriales bacterium]